MESERSESNEMAKTEKIPRARACPMGRRRQKERDMKFPGEEVRMVGGLPKGTLTWPRGDSSCGKEDMCAR